MFITSRNEFTKKAVLFIACAAICAAGLALAFSMGQAEIPLKNALAYITGVGDDAMDARHRVILGMRLGRAAVAFIAGAGLAFSGVIYQSALKNYLADPFMLGVSAGAALFSAIAIALKFDSSAAISVFAFAGAIVSVAGVILISGLRRFATYNLILSGIAINSFFSSFLTIVMYLSRDMQNIFFWLMGSLELRYPGQIVYTYGLVLLALGYCVYRSRILDILMLNEKTVFSLGIDETAWKIKFIAISSVVCALIVSQTGIIGFVGLIIPHAARMIVGDRHFYLLPFSFLLGGTMMIYCDLISRTIVDSMNFPIGVVTSLVGAPFFILLLSGYGRTERR